VSGECEKCGEHSLECSCKKEMKPTLPVFFSHKFLDELQARCETLGVIEYVMQKEDLSFVEAVLHLSVFFGMQPEYRLPD